ncbi:hypothetical protein BDA99DRAFT_121311 [Phascolomyces articulosus]|uniref:F-box domain-containing protein n=1 Tax=Phascolomyces articulosus TaxID=60185 RepID=A0AAD5PLB1_9FUNG|nr:hypothetical protein BDA99DRAFT_121311 [Phascolomyces articulosus]
MNSIETNLKNYPFICHGDAYKTLTQTQFRDCSVIKESFEQGKKAFAAKNYKWAVNSFTQTIESLASNLSMVLMHRAAAFEMQQKYESAFNDGQRAIYNIANSSTLNIYSDTHHATLRDAFITTSNALIHQNLLKEAALQYRQAIEILPMVSPYFLELSLRHRQVTAEIANRNKWLNRYLPREVVFRIVSFLPLEDRGQLAMTCRFWYDLVLSQSSDMWRLMDVTDPKFPGKLASIQKLLRSVVPNRIGKVKLYLENKREDIRMVTEEDDNNSDISEANSTATTVESIPMVVDSDDENYEDDEKQCDYEQRSQLIYSAMFERNWNNIPEFGMCISIRCGYIKRK